MSGPDIAEKIEEYSRFVSEKLHPELRSAETARNEVRAEIHEYKELGEKLKDFQKENKHDLETMVDLGHQTVYCNAVANLDKIYVHVGMGFHVEMSIAEAIRFIGKRVSFLEKDVLKGKDLRVREITNHIMGASAILDDLNQELQRST